MTRGRLGKLALVALGLTVLLAAVAMLPADRDVSSFVLLLLAAVPTLLLFLWASPRVLPGRHGREAMIGGFLAYVLVGAAYTAVVHLIGEVRFILGVVAWPGFLTADLGCLLGLWGCLSIGA